MSSYRLSNRLLYDQVSLVRYRTHINSLLILVTERAAQCIELHDHVSNARLVQAVGIELVGMSCPNASDDDLVKLSQALKTANQYIRNVTAQVWAKHGIKPGSNPPRFSFFNSPVGIQAETLNG